MDFLLLFLGFVPLLWGADRLVEGGSSLAARFRVPPMVIGLTIVAFGTSTPELVVNLLSATSGQTDLALANITGSNIFNLLGILGVSALILPLTVRSSTTWTEIPLVILSAAVLLFLAFDDGARFSWADGALLLAFFAIFLAYTVHLSRTGQDGDLPAIRDRSAALSTFWIVVGLAGLVLGGKLIVDGAVGVARSLGWSERLIGLTIVAVGTSLPELATSAVAAVKKQTDIAVGNVVGSNLFNAFFILGVTALIAPIPLRGPEFFDLWVNLAASALLLVFVFWGKGRTLNRVEGGLFVALYVGYVAWLAAGA